MDPLDYKVYRVQFSQARLLHQSSARGLQRQTIPARFCNAAIVLCLTVIIC